MSCGSPCFNPRPPISQRATRQLRRYVARASVSIHARQFHSGRRTSGYDRGTPARFQSTPANFTAGDAPRAGPARGLGGFNPRPPISQRATRPVWLRQPSSSFQSTPANFTAGDTSHGHQGQGIDAVSIHARQFHSGRPVSWQARPLAALMFQSTPANFTAGDYLIDIERTLVDRFQSTPANFTAGDRRKNFAVGR